MEPTPWTDLPNKCYICGASVQTRDLPRPTGLTDIEFRCTGDPSHGFVAVAISTTTATVDTNQLPKA